MSHKINPILGLPFSFSARKAALSALDHSDIDVLILGGGITGAGCLREATHRGLKAVLVESQDFAFGTSAYSSKFIHGGLRYLETFDLPLVYEGLQERHILLKTAPDLVSSQPFIVPVYTHSRRPLWQILAGCWLYHALGALSGLPRPRLLGREELDTWAPGLASDNLLGAVLYYDAITVDTSLVLANLQDAWRHGGMALNYMGVSNIAFDAKDRRYTLTLEDRSSHGTGYVSAVLRPRHIVNATGPWSELTHKQFLVPHSPTQLRLTQGSHLILDETLPRPKAALVTEHPEDGRVTFIYPWQGATVVGTTDTDYQGAPEASAVSPQDEQYLLTLYRHYFPQSGASSNHIVSRFAGLRPLVLTRPKAQAPSEVSRKHMLTEVLPQFFSIQGGKLTSYRRMAEDVIRALGTCKGHSPTRWLHLPAPQALSLSRDANTLEAAALEAKDHEMCGNLEDFLRRRTWLHYTAPEQAQELRANATWTQFFK